MFNLIINYSAGLLWLTRLNLAFCPHVNNSDCVWRASNHGDRHGHWHGDEAQQWPSTPRIPWCDPGWVIIDASVTGHCIHCCITQTERTAIDSRTSVCVLVCAGVCASRGESLCWLQSVCAASTTHCGRESEGVNERERETWWLSNNMIKHKDKKHFITYSQRVLRRKELPLYISSWNVEWQLTAYFLTWKSMFKANLDFLCTIKLHSFFWQR